MSFSDNPDWESGGDVQERILERNCRNHIQEENPRRTLGLIGALLGVDIVGMVDDHVREQFR